MGEDFLVPRQKKNSILCLYHAYTIQHTRQHIRLDELPFQAGLLGKGERQTPSDDGAMKNYA